MTKITKMILARIGIISILTWILMLFADYRVCVGAFGGSLFAIIAFISTYEDTIDFRAGMAYFTGIMMSTCFCLSMNISVIIAIIMSFIMMQAIVIICVYLTLKNKK